MRITTHDKELRTIFRGDQEDRRSHLDLEEITFKDRKRRKRLKELISTGKLQTGSDYYYSALIFQHGLSKADYRKALALITKAAKLQVEEDVLWLRASIIDRLLLAEGKKQRFGTQLESVNYRGKWVTKLCPYDRRISEATRIRNGVPPLESKS